MQVISAQDDYVANTFDTLDRAVGGRSTRGVCRQSRRPRRHRSSERGFLAGPDRGVAVRRANRRHARRRRTGTGGIARGNGSRCARRRVGWRVRPRRPPGAYFGRADDSRSGADGRVEALHGPSDGRSLGRLFGRRRDEGVERNSFRLGREFVTRCVARSSFNHPFLCWDCGWLRILPFLATDETRLEHGYAFECSAIDPCSIRGPISYSFVLGGAS